LEQSKKEWEFNGTGVGVGAKIYPQKDQGLKGQVMKFWPHNNVK